MQSSWLKLMGAFEFVMDAFVLTMCFLLGTVLGGVILGVAPAFSALTWASDGRAEGVGASALTLFWKRYFSDFWGANRELLLPLLITLFLAYDYALADVNMRGSWRLPLLGLLGVAICVAGLIFVHLLRGRGLGYLDAARLVLTRPLDNLLYLTTTFLLVRISMVVTGFAVLLVWGLWARTISSFAKLLDTHRMR